MKKIITLLIVFVILLSNSNVVHAQEKEDFDLAINDVILGIDDAEFEKITELLNLELGKNFSLKEWILSFISGEFTINFSDLKALFSSLYSEVISSVSHIVIYIIFIGILSSFLNVINSKNNGKNAKYIIYYICYTLIITLTAGLVSKVISTAKNSIDDMCKTVDLCFPTLLALSEFSGGFGINVAKPLIASVSFFTTVICNKVFLPILSMTIVCVIVGNFSETVKLDSLKKTLLSLVKWLLGILTVVFTVVIAGQSIVNAQYSGMSFKVLKYATGSIIPIVGGFISGGLDVLFASAILVKNSLGLVLVIFIFFKVVSAGVTVLIVSFILKFAVSVSEPILDGRFCKLLNGVGEVFSYLTAVIFVCGFSYILVCFSIISSTALII